MKSTWRGSIFTISDLSPSNFFIQAGSSAENSGVDLGSNYADSLSSGTDFYTTNPDPNMGDPILIYKESQYDNTPWEIGATKLTGSLGSSGSTSSNIQPPSGLILSIPPQ